MRFASRTSTGMVSPNSFSRACSIRSALTGPFDSNTTLPLLMYVTTFEYPRLSNTLRSAAIGTLLFPPTLIARSSATYFIARLYTARLYTSVLVHLFACFDGDRQAILRRRQRAG